MTDYYLVVPVLIATVPFGTWQSSTCSKLLFSRFRIRVPVRD